MRFHIDIPYHIPLIFDIIGRKPQPKPYGHVDIVDLKHMVLVESFKYFVSDFEQVFKQMMIVVPLINSLPNIGCLFLVMRRKPSVES